MPERMHSPDSDIDATRASARLPGLDIDIVRRQSPTGDWEQMSINLRATPSFEALGSPFEAADPFTFWVQATRLMWMPWLVTAQTMLLPAGWPYALPSAIHPEQEAPTASGSRAKGSEKGSR
ncbi:hypothetical protein [Bradyrhizobium japonicum]|uniref:hypothetical protein n=1 Tax=Bradyrhizobium japonicum TaxID=375 RepID=UPI001BAC3CE4|nr:hypothetical protein [Bradyrhizobium japonicum]MBR0960039.1 hypothetical protein [Bradyrhizobium japonicum]